MCFNFDFFDKKKKYLNRKYFFSKTGNFYNLIYQFELQ